MKPVSPHLIVRTVLVLLSLSAISYAQDDGRYDMHVDRGVVKRGPGEFTIHAIYVPDLAKPGTTLDQATMDLNRIADVGAETACFDLYGIDEDGQHLSEDAIAAMRQIREIGYDRGMIGMVRVFGPLAPKTAKARLRAARTVAKALKDERQYVYLLEGADAGRLAREFQRRAPGLLVASPLGGNIQVIGSPDVKSNKPTLLLGAVPPELKPQAHFLLPQGDESYRILDFASVEPVENHAWNPDNSSLTPEERAGGWIALFDGKTFNGWTILGQNQKAWIIHDGVLERVTSGSHGLRTRNRFGNYILRWEWCLPKGGNNGVHLRAPRAARASKIGMEFQMLGDYGDAPNKNSTGSVYDVIAPTVNAVKPNGEWNTSEVELNGSHLKYVLNGVTVQDVNLYEQPVVRLRLRHGFIVLTEHNDPVWYRNIKIKPLPTPEEQMAIPAEW